MANWIGSGDKAVEGAGGGLGPSKDFPKIAGPLRFDGDQVADPPSQQIPQPPNTYLRTEHGHE